MSVSRLIGKLSARQVDFGDLVPGFSTLGEAGETTTVVATGGAAMTLSVVLPLRAPAVAVTVCGPEIEPPPETLQMMAGCTARGWPYW
jgi:hypothetical protein